MKTETRKEGAFSRLAGLLTGGAKPRSPQALFMVLLVLGVLSLAGVVSADDYYNGTAPVTKLHGCVNGGVDVQFADTWNKTPVTDWSHQETWGNFTLNLPEGATVKFAELFVVPYMGSMSANYYGNMTVQLYNGDTANTTIVYRQPLDLTYNNITGTRCNTSVSVPPYESADYGLCRVTSDYVAVFNITDNLAGWSGSNFNVNLKSYNTTGHFDGRFKEAKLVYGWDVPGSTTYTCYWKNIGQDPITKKIGTYTANQTVFSGVTIPAAPNAYTAKLWVDYVAGNSTSGPGYGNYWLNADDIDISPGSGYDPQVNQGVYAGLNSWSWDRASNPGIVTGDNTLKYSRTNDYYKIIMALLTVSPCSSCP